MRKISLLRIYLKGEQYVGITISSMLTKRKLYYTAENVLHKTVRPFSTFGGNIFIYKKPYYIDVEDFSSGAKRNAMLRYADREWMNEW